MSLALQHSPADILQQVLIDEGFGTSPSAGATWPIFATNEPSSPDDAITVFDTAGTDSGRSMIDGELFGRDGFQVRVRSREHKAGYQKASDIQQHLAEGLYQETKTIESKTYLIHACVRLGGVLPIGKDVPTAKRSVFTINGQAVISRTS